MLKQNKATRKPQIVNLIGKSYEASEPIIEAEYERIRNTKDASIRIYAESRAFWVRLDLDYWRYDLSESGFRAIESISEANTWMCWTKHPKASFVTPSGPKTYVIPCLSEEIAIATAEAIALVLMSRWQEPQAKERIW